LGLANGFFSSTRLGVPLPLPGALPLPPAPTPNSALKNASSISFGSEVSIFLDANADTKEESERIEVADACTPRAAEEYNILYLTGEEEGQEYINTVFGG
jgi:hypothetical protein